MFHASTCITSVAPSVARILGFAPPKCAGDGNPALDQLAADAFSGRKADRALLYNPDAIAHHLFAHYADLFLPVLRHAPLALPMQSVMPSVTPVCFASMYTGALPDVHGIQAYVKPVLTCDTLFDAAIRAGRKPAIVSTNLPDGELETRYSAQIASRLLGAYTLYQFCGSDVRLLKKMEKQG